MRTAKRSQHPAFQIGNCIAFCYRSGQIGLTEGGPVPDGALMIARGHRNEIESCVHGLSRLAYDNETWLVPGIPEAADEDKAFKAMMTFIDRIAMVMARRAKARS